MLANSKSAENLTAPGSIPHVLHHSLRGRRRQGRRSDSQKPSSAAQRCTLLRFRQRRRRQDRPLCRDCVSRLRPSARFSMAQVGGRQDDQCQDKKNERSKWLPEGVLYALGTAKLHPLRLDTDMTMPTNEWVETPLVLPQSDSHPSAPRAVLSCQVHHRDVNKVINLCMLRQDYPLDFGLGAHCRGLDPRCIMLPVNHAAVCTFY